MRSRSDAAWVGFRRIGLDSLGLIWLSLDLARLTLDWLALLGLVWVRLGLNVAWRGLAQLGLACLGLLFHLGLGLNWHGLASPG